MSEAFVHNLSASRSENRNIGNLLASKQSR